MGFTNEVLIGMTIRGQLEVYWDRQLEGGILCDANREAVLAFSSPFWAKDSNKAEIGVDKEALKLFSQHFSGTVCVDCIPNVVGSVVSLAWGLLKY